MLLAVMILGVVQGLTEFLPVSSSGHLVLFQELLTPPGDPLVFDLAVHLGTLIPVIVVFWDDLWGLVDFKGNKGSSDAVATQGWRPIALIVLGSIPTAFIGFTFKDQFEALFHNAGTLIITFAITGTLLFLTKFAKQGATTLMEMPWVTALIIGTVQGLAITPGISRSGSTIAIALFLGLSRDVAAKFSFLLSIPAIGGAMLLMAKDVNWAEANIPMLLAGALTAAASGYLALKLLLKLVNSGDFSRFAWYCWAMAGVAAFVYLQ